MLAMLVAACGGSNAEAISTDNGGKIMQSENKTNSSKALVVYYSRSGNTEALARMIGNETGADMFRVTTVTHILKYTVKQLSLPEPNVIITRVLQLTDV